MKKAIQLLSIIFVFGLTFTSCTSSDNDVAEARLLKNVIEVNTDGTTSTYNFTYTGTKIVSIISENKSSTFTYTGDLITKITELNLATNVQTTFDYTYTADRLTKVICSDNYELNYTYNADGTVSYEKTTVDASNNTVLLFHGTISFQGENVYDNNKTLDTTAANVVSKEQVSFVYDAKRNPFNNITGYNKLLDHYNTISANNTASSTEIASTSYLDTDQAISSLKQYPRSFQYNSGYPTEIVSDKPVFENQNNNHLKSVYIYY